MVERSNNRRRILVVNKDVQKRIVLSVSLFPTIALTMTTVIMAVFCRKLLGEAARTEAELPSLVPLFLSILGFTCCAAVIVVYQALIFSNRVAGPSYRLGKSFERVCEGDLDFRVQLRRGDHLVELADGFNAMLDYLNENAPPGAKTRGSAAAAREAEAQATGAQPAETPTAEGVVVGHESVSS